MVKSKDLDISSNTTPNSSPHLTKSSKEASKELLNKCISEETKLVKGRFKNYETPGGSVKVIIRKYAGVTPFDQVLKDGEIYEIPLYVARHLQGYDVTAKAVGGRINSCAYAVHQYKNSKDDFPTQNMDQGMTVPIIHKRRYGFESLEFENAI